MFFIKMTHEFIRLIKVARSKKKQKSKCVLASIVFLDGSSYRKPGVRMLIDENGSTTGAVSGGCVENEICRRSASVFETGEAKIITYDGRYRLGCEGILYILIEPFDVPDDLYNAFLEHIEARKHFRLDSYFKKEDEAVGGLGSVLSLDINNIYRFSENKIINEENQLFTQHYHPRFKLLIIGAEHDAVKLCSMASLIGWEVTVVSSMKDPKSLSDFPGATRVLAENPDTADLSDSDLQTAIVLMNHNYTLDLQYLIKLHNLQFCYLGLLGSSRRWERLQDEILNYVPDVSLTFFEKVYSPAGLNIGSETPEEIALSILSEILCITRDKSPSSLRNLNNNFVSRIE